MSNKLKEFIDNNRESLDNFEPRDLWSNINEGLNNPSPKIKVKKPLKGWFLGGIGTAVVVTAVCVYEYVQSGADFVKNEIAEYKQAPQPEKETLPVVIDDSTKNKRSPNKNVVSTQTMAPSEKVVKEEKEGQPATEPVPVTTVTPTPPTEPVKPAEEKTAGNENKKEKKDKKKYHHIVDSTFVGITRLEVEGHSCDIVVKTHDAGNITFHGDINSNKTIHNLRTEKNGTTLRVFFEFPHGARSKIAVGLANYSAILEFVVPAQMDVVIKNSAGNAYVSGITANIFDLKSSLGDLKIENCKAPEFKLYTNSGDIKAQNLIGNITSESTLGDQKYETIQGNIITNSKSGDLIVRDIKGNVTAVTTLGNQTYQNSIGDIIAKATSGDVRLTNAKGNYKLKTAIGDIIGSDVELTASSEMESSSGDIKMILKNDFKDLSFDLHATSGDVSVLNGEEQFKKGNVLVLNKGPITVKGTTKIGDQIFR
jgi:hypothetical protein